MGTAQTIIGIGGLAAVVGIGWYFYSKGYFDSIISAIQNGLKLEPKEDEGIKDPKDEEDTAEEETPKCKSGEEYDEEKKKCVKSKTSNLAVAYIGQQGPFRAYRVYRM